uniref:Ubiquitin carboxyl-terminal hydrolase n=1 Tax=Erythrolobus australicus TaxID=1077150 RepID=A0A7S1TKL3_9RHOD|mmetsp:Transcript_2549/g.6929  ORF Transcript_2549/g.6929 Transcript_2549/m.6929 type:complete len:513 (+) Transcript_2549:94-1632(+)|eukprot:CAMPEP_0185834058 /NCGR_PEP_ID=MMETSP1353-20130828/4141_1 /TAXON_ID=1077150 /ORGANISM="Erythrolobus australicus, Strain CCMP3124" /LENGTH=512 /DNA_ID=CAMNT_0028532411 /DNA_START=36 /DNA_END=1574 /DNA_ORIENTATION=-
MGDSTAAPVLVNVKFQKTVLKDVELDMNEPVEVFKSQLWTLTGVPVERQTVLGFKGGKLKDDANWDKLGVKPGMTLMLLGTPGELPAEPVKKAVFAEDLPKDALPSGDSADEKRSLRAAQYRGLLNLGNTCYLNSALQCLAQVPEVSTRLHEASSAAEAGTASVSPAENNLTLSMHQVLRMLKVPVRDQSSSDAAISPLHVLTALRTINPQFSERNQEGFYAQQDAEECWSVLLQTLSRTLRSSTTASTGGGERANAIDDIFRLDLIVKDRCVDSGEEKEETEVSRLLKCAITNKVSHLDEGLRAWLHASGIERHSEQLGRSAEWERTTTIARLPPYVVVNFVRFLWKPTESVKAKILRPVSFPVELLDLHEYCTPELKEKLAEPRSKLRAKLDEATSAAVAEAAASVSAEPGSAMAIDRSSAVGGEQSATRSHVINEEDITGMYELDAVLTHQGRYADAGHYIAWVRVSGDDWVKLDDEKVSACTSEDIKKLSGGGDWHIAYICLYRSKML